MRRKSRKLWLGSIIVVVTFLILFICWSRAPLKELAALTGHASGINALVFTADGKFLLSASDDSIGVWDVATKTLLRHLWGDGYGVHALAISPDQRTLASASGTVILWDLNTYAEVARLPSGLSPSSLAFSRDGATLAVGEYAKIEFWDVATRRLRNQITMSEFESPKLSYSPDGETLAGSDETAEEIVLFDIPSEKERLRLKLKIAPRCVNVPFRSDSKALVAEARGGHVNLALWDTTTGQKRVTLDAPFIIYCADLNHDGTLVAAGGQLPHTPPEKGTVRVFNLATGRAVTFGGHDPYVGAVAFSPDGALLATASGSLRFTDYPRPGVITLWSVETLLEHCRE